MNDFIIRSDLPERRTIVLSVVLLVSNSHVVTAFYLGERACKLILADR